MADRGQQGKGRAGSDPLEEVFQTLRQQVTETRGGEDIAEQHYLLAVECWRQGRVDQAKTAPEVAADSPRHLFPAATMLGQLYRDEGRLDESVAWFERAAAVLPPTPEEGWTLLYDLGTTLEGLGHLRRALAVFLELEATAGSHRDVRGRIARLSRALLGG